MDFAAMLVAFILAMRIKTHSWTLPIGILFVAYFFAWVGHFYFEHNKPATFIYPLYSLISDFVMFGETVTMRRAF